MEILLYIAIVVCSPLQSATAKIYCKTSKEVLAFNLIKAFSAFVLFALVGVWGFTFHKETLIISALYGVALALSMHFGYKALEVGPMALTSLIVSFSVIIPIVYGLGFSGEVLTLFKGLGFIFLVGAIILTNIKKGGDVSSKVNLKWLLYVFLTFFANGICSVLQKYHQEQFPKMYSREFMLNAMAVCFLIYLCISLIKIRPSQFKSIEKKRFGAYSGVLNGVANFCTILLAGYENASVLFPTISVGTILGAMLVGRFMFKEKLKINHYLALFFGVVAIVFLKI